MIYVFYNGDYQIFPKPDKNNPNTKQFIEVDGITEEKILNGERYNVNQETGEIEFVSEEVILQEKLEEAKIEKRSIIESERKQSERSGFLYTFPDGTDGTVQLRSSDDKVNITGLVVGAQASPTKTFQFRDGENISHDMSASEIIALGDAVQDFISTNYAQAWTLKAQLDNATTIAEVEAITP